MPQAYQCYGYRSLPKQYDSPPQVLVELAEAEVIHKGVAFTGRRPFKRLM
jgi:hypothetical protein